MRTRTYTPARFRPCAGTCRATSMVFALSLFVARSHSVRCGCGTLGSQVFACNDKACGQPACPVGLQGKPKWKCFGKHRCDVGGCSSDSTATFLHHIMAHSIDTSHVQKSTSSPLQGISCAAGKHRTVRAQAASGYPRHFKQFCANCDPGRFQSRFWKSQKLSLVQLAKLRK